MLISGAPNDGFLLKTLKHFLGYQEYRYISRSCILSGAIKSGPVRSSSGELESFRNYKGFSIIFPKVLDAM